MKSLKFFIPLLVTSVLLGGCPYQSSVPIDEPNEKINTALLGNWEKKNTTGSLYKISKQDDYHYRIEKRGDEKKEVSVYNAYTSTINGTTFLNMEDEAQKDGYFLYKVTINTGNNKITLEEITENIDEKFTTSVELMAFISKNKELSFFYSKEADVFYKAD